MSTPEGHSGDGVSSQLLLKINDNVSTLVTDVAVIKSQMSGVPELEKRLRAVEDTQAASQAATQVGRDNQARIVAWLAAAAGLGSGAAGWFHH